MIRLADASSSDTDGRAEMTNEHGRRRHLTNLVGEERAGLGAARTLTPFPALLQASVSS